MRIKALDHIIIGDNRYFSFAGAGLIEEYELGFLNLKMKGVSEGKRRLYKAKPGTSELPWEA
jgi:DNA repair protein RadC